MLHEISDLLYEVSDDEGFAESIILNMGSEEDLQQLLEFLKENVGKCIPKDIFYESVVISQNTMSDDEF